MTRSISILAVIVLLQVIGAYSTPTPAPAQADKADQKSKEGTDPVQKPDIDSSLEQLIKIIDNDDDDGSELDDLVNNELTKRGLPMSGSLYGKRAIPFNGGLYGKRARPVPMSGGLYGKRAVPFNGGLYG